MQLNGLTDRTRPNKLAQPDETRPSKRPSNEGNGHNSPTEQNRQPIRSEVDFQTRIPSPLLTSPNRSLAIVLMGSSRLGLAFPFSPPHSVLVLMPVGKLHATEAPILKATSHYFSYIMTLVRLWPRSMSISRPSTLAAPRP
jgi:hypothetical protein